MVIVALAVGAFAAEPELTGRYALAEEPADLARTHEQAVQEALEQLSWAFRPFARGKLAEAVKNCPSLDLSLTERRFRSECEGDDPFDHDRASPTGKLTADDGKVYDVRFEVGAEQVEIRIEGEDGGQETTYDPRPDGTLLVTKSLFSEYLAKPVAWTVRYREVE